MGLRNIGDPSVQGHLGGNIGVQGWIWGCREIAGALTLGIHGSFVCVPQEVTSLAGDGSEGDTPGSPESPSPGGSPSDLRFHRLHGTNAVITNGGRTALRQNCRSEFNDAIVISNRSGAPQKSPPCTPKSHLAPQNLLLHLKT